MNYHSPPPPYYQSIEPGSSNVNERTPLTKPSGPHWHRVRVRPVLFVIAVVVLLLQNLGLLLTLADGVSPTKAELRRQWEGEMANHDRQAAQWMRERLTHRRELELWKVEVEERQRDRVVWQKEVQAERDRWAREGAQEHRERQAERNAWLRKMAEERAAEEHSRQKLRDEFMLEHAGWVQQRQEEERHRKEIERRRQGVWWSEPWHEGSCREYGTRAYLANLWDIPDDLNWLEVCMDIPMQLNGRWNAKPDRCERNDKGHVWATWLIKDEPDCTKYWERLYDMGCSSGQSGMRRYEARLMNLKRGEDWDMMCRTTPATILGVHYDHPTICEDRNGRTGVWDHPDARCH